MRLRKNLVKSAWLDYCSRTFLILISHGATPPWFRTGFVQSIVIASWSFSQPLVEALFLFSWSLIASVHIGARVHVDGDSLLIKDQFPWSHFPIGYSRLHVSFLKYFPLNSSFTPNLLRAIDRWPQSYYNYFTTGTCTWWKICAEET